MNLVIHAFYPKGDIPANPLLQEASRDKDNVVKALLFCPGRVVVDCPHYI